jgi:hypothetical protein
MTFSKRASWQGAQAAGVLARHVQLHNSGCARQQNVTPNCNLQVQRSFLHRLQCTPATTSCQDCQQQPWLRMLLKDTSKKRDTLHLVYSDRGCKHSMAESKPAVCVLLHMLHTLQVHLGRGLRH